MSEHIKIPLVNSFRFTLKEPTSAINTGDFDYILDADEQCKNMLRLPYYQIVKVGDVTTIQIESNYDLTNNAEIRRISDDSLIDTIAGVEKKDYTDFHIIEFAIDWTAIVAGYYYIKLIGTGTGLTDYLAESEPIHCQSTLEPSVLLRWYLFSNGHGIEWTTNITMQMRIPKRKLRRAQSGGDQDIAIDSGNQPQMIESDTYRLIQFITKELPDWLHELVEIISKSDYLEIEGVRYSREGAYNWGQSPGANVSDGELTLRQHDWNYQNLHDAGDRVSPPLAASDLTLDAVSSTQIDLISWTINQLDGNNNPNADYQEIIRQGSVVATLSKTSTTYSDSGLTPDTLYNYKIRTWKDGLFADSVTASATTILPDPLQLYDSSLQFWFDAEDLNLNSGNGRPEQLNEKSGKGRHIYQVTAAKQAIQNTDGFGYKNINLWNGSGTKFGYGNTEADFGSPLGLPYVLFVLHRYAPSPSNNRRTHLADNDPTRTQNNGGLMLYSGTTSRITRLAVSRGGSDEIRFTGDTVDFTGLMAFIITDNRQNSRAYRNGVDVTSNPINDAVTDTLKSLAIGATTWLNEDQIGIQHYQIFAASDMSASKFNKAHEWLAQKYPEFGIVNPNLS